VKTCEPLMRIASCLLVLVGACGSMAAGPEWRSAQPDYSWTFPRDHWTHADYRNEWWYFTGHLRAVDDPQREFGYQFTLFRIGLLREPPDLDSAWAVRSIAMGHASLGDMREQSHRFSDVIRRTAPFLAGFARYPEHPLGWILAPAGTDDRWEVDWDGNGFRFRMRDDARGMAFELTARPEKPIVLQGPNGYSRKADRSGAASQYYSFTRLATEGTVTLDGRTWRVVGSSWMDKEFSSNSITEAQVGWDWFSLQLDGGRDLMLFVLRREDGTTDFANGTIVDPSGTPTYLAPEDWTLAAEATWESPATDATYPSRWLVEVPSAGLELRVVPRFADQENVGRETGGLFYWEGAVDVLDPTGARVGRGYVELTGYGEDNRPPI
jgi:predicted secreted hydrolase